MSSRRLSKTLLFLNIKGVLTQKLDETGNVNGISVSVHLSNYFVPSRPSFTPIDVYYYHYYIILKNYTLYI